MPTTEEILRELVAIPSVTSMSNGPLLDALSAFLAPQDWFTERFSYVAADGIEKANMLAIPERFRNLLPEVELLFVCHTDTVPFRSEWLEATQLLERDGALHGCGACDVKGSMAGLISAALQVSPETMSAPVAFAFTAEEEIGCIGATRLAAGGAIRPRRVVVCEPTSLRPALAGKGYGLAEVCVRGHEAHSAFPAKGVSAINAAAQVVVLLEQCQQTSDKICDPLFNPPHTTFNVGVMHGGSAKNIVAGECKFLVEWRPVPAEEPSHGGDVLQQLAEKVASQNPHCAIDVRILRADSGFASKSESRLGAFLSQRPDRPQTGISFGSEATRFTPLAEEVVVIGPGDMETAHSERECIVADELEEWTEIVKLLVRKGVQ